jgi:hypothetical protein
MREAKEAPTTEAMKTRILDIKVRLPTIAARLSSDATRRLCEEVVAWQNEVKVTHLPRSKCKEDRERKLGGRVLWALRRRFKAERGARLNFAERVMINRIHGVSARGCYTSPGLAVAVEYSNSTVTKRQVEAELVTDMASKHRCTKTPILGDAMNSDMDSSKGRTDRVPLYSAKKMPGSVQRNGEYGWRFQVRIDGKNYIGPYRRDKVDAEADMREAKEAPTIEAMKTRIREIKVRCWEIAGATASPAETEADTSETKPEHRVSVNAVDEQRYREFKSAGYFSGCGNRSGQRRQAEYAIDAPS